jgi:cell division transport system permease protein
MEEKRVKRKKPSAVPSILSLTAVMFMMGLLGTSWLAFKGLGNYWLETTSIDIYFNDDVNESFVKNFQSEIEKKPWVKSTQFVSREQAMKEMGDKYDPNFMNYVETVTLPLSLEIYPKAEYAKPDFFSELSIYFKQQENVEDVIFQQNWLESMTENLQKIQIAATGITLVLCLVAIVLIQSSVRLGIFANRHTIKSMQLVGATNGFIVRPFIWKFMSYAFISIPIAFFLVWLLFWGIPNNSEFFPMIKTINAHIDFQQLGIFSLSIAIFGVLLAAISSWMSTRKFLKMKIDNLY